ncbi:MAG: MarR family transcriptional regulator [SAR86 cluster bacterium]|uniref:MarR family transcriptional regulator n=1 Tax=SAR86 cluster bacterium TaxID=2030880 RepID=A0A2A4MV90_9GAMM|nr:MAG: MarR family transcriptional regulator [SAR86 cluster bacterium]
MQNFKQQPSFKIRVLQQNAVSIFMEECRDHGITPLQYALLSALQYTPGIDQKAIAKEVALDASTLGNIAIRIAKRGMIDRYPGQHDRRAKMLYLTTAGQELLSQVEEGVEKTQQRILAPLSVEERQQFLGLLAKLSSYEN